MKRFYHESIFYPEDKEELLKLTEISSKEAINASALILPIGDLRKLSSLYKSAFSKVRDKKRIIIIVPIHNELLEEDKEEIALEGEVGALATPLGDIKLVSLGLKKNEAYAEEEPAGEIPLQFIARYFKEAEVSIIYAKVDTARKSKELSKLLEKLQNEDTLFIITSNLTGKIKAGDIEDKRAKAAELIISSSHLIDAINKREAEISAAGIIDSYNRVNENKWILIGFADEDTITGHGAFYKL